jgi:hypothetical protein
VRGQLRLSLRLRALSGSLPALRQPGRPAPHAAQGGDRHALRDTTLPSAVFLKWLVLRRPW